MEPSRQTRSSYGPPYPLGRWSSLLKEVLNTVKKAHLVTLADSQEKKPTEKRHIY